MTFNKQSLETESVKWKYTDSADPGDTQQLQKDNFMSNNFEYESK